MRKGKGRGKGGGGRVGGGGESETFIQTLPQLLKQEVSQNKTLTKMFF